MGCSWALAALVLGFLVVAVHGSEPWLNQTQVYSTNANSGSNGVFVGITLIQSAAAKGAGIYVSLFPELFVHSLILVFFFRLQRLLFYWPCLAPM
jgi:hypothetical protein